MASITIKVQYLGAVQLLCNTSRGEGGGMSKYDFVLYGGRGSKRKYDFVFCDVGGGSGGPNMILNDKGLWM